MVDAQSLLDSKFAHVVAIVLGLVGIVALVASSTGLSFWFWVFYGLAWLTFLDLFEDDEAFWNLFSSDSERESETKTAKSNGVEGPTEDPLALLKRRYAEGRIDDDEFDERLERLLDTPDTLRELEMERSRS
ncbi:Uncharacterized membrane protein [Halogranum amylolyticum]|uniref:Uncharacterized membrane protein n=1 Tax=Halogranum amylolyticum TaxID=660520 RepID=A0A1H8P0S1_9EURY|nr:SHOCT domain-containing protein [Halogranum amylolyticum]SEO35414.1 Uncharacterized membrane protein [Halogranum amylolyticum]